MRATLAKAHWGWLATMQALCKRKHAEEGMCPLCGAAVESNWHLVAECTHESAVQCRRQGMQRMRQEVRKVLKHHGADRELEEAVLHMWSLDADGKMVQWA